MAANNHDERPEKATHSFPTFLDNDPYPNQTPDGRPTTAGSGVTDATSDFESEFGTMAERPSNIPSITGPVGEAGLPPSRPATSSAASTSQRGGSTRQTQPPPSSRKALTAMAARSGGALRGPGSDAGDASRPNTSSTTRTHVPSLTAQGFSRPMSSQKLQAQRGQRPQSGLTQNVQKARVSEDADPQHRYSNASLNTLRDGMPPTRDGEVPPLPMSRGTQFTHEGTQLEGPGSVVSNNSTVPLQTRRGQDPPKLEMNGMRNSNSQMQPAQKSPRSLRASLGLSSRRASRNDIERRPSPGQHEKLHSNPSSPSGIEKEKAPYPSDHRQPPQPQPGPGRNYEYFAGNMLFFLSGRCMNTRAKPLNLATFLMTALPAALFFGFSAPWLWHHVSPAIPIIFAYIFYIAISSFLHAAFSDPGILPRNLHPHPPNPDEDRDPLTVGPPTTEWVMVKTFPSSKSTSAKTDASEEQRPGGLTAMEVPTKYCKACSIWRPPRAHHCRICDACIETQDHHCVWLNNCVGRRNYRFFFAFVGFASILALLLLAFTVTHISSYASQHGITFQESLTGRTQERVAFAMFLYSLLALPYPGSLFVYHLFLLARGETTREYLNSHKFLPKDRHRPFSLGSWAKNWAGVLSRPRPPTYLQFRRRYVVGDMRYGHLQTKKQRKQDMKGRYSVGGDEAKGNGMAEKGVEMKPLTPLSERKHRSAAGGSAGGLSGPINSTPRL